MRTFLPVLIAGALLAAVAGCGSSKVSGTTLSWHSCDVRFECATLRVPTSYSDPKGPQISIAVTRLVASGPHPIGDLVLNPGGPGASGVHYLQRNWQEFPASLLARFTLVGFDPRGVGASEPLKCLTRAGLIAHAGLNPAPHSPFAIHVLVEAAKAFVHGCEQHASTAFIASMSTANNARDMDRLRAALGESKLTYMGLSYGTYLGTVYAEMFPKKVRALVLDGAVDPALDAEGFEGGQNAGFERNLRDFFPWCARHANCWTGTPGPAKAYATLMDRFKRGWGAVGYLRPEFGGRVRVNYGVAVLGVLDLLYSKNAWPILGQALRKALDGNGTYLALGAFNYEGQTSDGSFSNIVSANAATACIDIPSPTTLQGYESLAKRVSKSAPNFGSQNAWLDLFCLYWPVPPHPSGAPAHAPGAPPILVVGSTEDPATPYAWAESLTKQLPRATLLTRNGEGHTAYRFSSCIRGWVAHYLGTLKMPPAGTVCASD